MFVDPDAGASETGPLVAAVEGALRLGLAGATDAPPVVAVVDPDTVPAARVARPTAFQLTVPGNAVLFGFFIALTCALGFAEERRSGTWRPRTSSALIRGATVSASSWRVTGANWWTSLASRAC